MKMFSLILCFLLCIFVESQQNDIGKWIYDDCSYAVEDAEKEISNRINSDENTIVLRFQRRPWHGPLMELWKKHKGTFNDALEICRLCFDGTLIMYNDTRKDVEDGKNQWIGVHRPANTLKWLWLDGMPVTNWEQYADKFSDDNLDPTKSYGILRVTKFITETHFEVIWLPIEKTASCFNDEQVKQMFQNISGPNFEECGYPGIMWYHTTCVKKIWPSCHYWNYTERACHWNKDYGSHNYVTHLARADNKNVTCERPQVKRSAIRCDKSKTCPVTPWSSWTDCPEMNYCNENPTVTRSRQRQKTSAECPQGSFYPHLEEVAGCNVSGCDKLKGGKV